MTGPASTIAEGAERGGSRSAAARAAPTGVGAPAGSEVIKSCPEDAPARADEGAAPRTWAATGAARPPDLLGPDRQPGNLATRQPADALLADAPDRRSGHLLDRVDAPGALHPDPRPDTWDHDGRPIPAAPTSARYGRYGQYGGRRWPRTRSVPGCRAAPSS